MSSNIIYYVGSGQVKDRFELIHQFYTLNNSDKTFFTKILHKLETKQQTTNCAIEFKVFVSKFRNY